MYVRFLNFCFCCIGTHDYYIGVSCILVYFSIFLLFEKMDYRNSIKFCVKNEFKCARTFKILTVTFGESTMSRTQVQLLYKRFKEGWENINYDGRSSRLSTSTIDENIASVKKMNLNNRRITIREIADDVDISPSNFYACVRHETCSSSGDVGDVQRWSNLLKKVIWFNDIETKAQSS